MRSHAKVVGSVIAVVVVVAGVFVLARSLNDTEAAEQDAAPASESPSPEQPPTPADHEKAARAAAKNGFAALVPSALPAGWQVTHAEFARADGRWHLTIEGDAGESVRLLQSEDPPSALVSELAQDARQAGQVNLERWQIGVWDTWEAGGATVATTTLPGGTSVALVGGSRGQVIWFAKRLMTVESD